MIKTLTIKVPDPVNEHELLMQMAGILFEKGIISSGQAAELVGIEKIMFLESIGRYGFSNFGEIAEEIADL